jgi:hypothetical protein
MSRRQFLKSAGVVGGVGLVGFAAVSSDRGADDRRQPPDGMSRAATDTPHNGTEPPTNTETADTPTESETATETPKYAGEFDTVVDLVEAGADPTGEEPINDVLTRVAADDTLVSIPPGKYCLAPLELRSYAGLGIASTGEQQVQFRPVRGQCRGREPYVRFTRVEDLLLYGLTFDFRGIDSGGVIHVLSEGDAVVRNVATVGSCPGQVATFRIDVRDESSTGLVEDLYAENVDDNSTLTGVYVGRSHSGELIFRSCQVRGFSDNGLYASAPGGTNGGDGVVHTVGGTYTNNNIAGVRLGTTGSTARDVDVVVDSVPPGDRVNARGIRLSGMAGQVVENCRVYIGPNAGQSFGAVVFNADNGGAHVRDSNIRVDRDRVQAVHTFPPAEPASEPPVFENLEITGTANSSYAATIQGRNGTVFRNCTIKQTGLNRGGIRLEGSKNCRIENCEIETTTVPIMLENASATILDTAISTPEGKNVVEELDAENEVVRPT